MVPNETLSRIRRVYEDRGSFAEHSKSGNSQTRGGIQKEGRCKSAQARAKAKGQDPRFPRYCRLASERLRVRLYLPHLACEFSIRQTFAGDFGYSKTEPLRICQVPLVVAKPL